MKDKKLNSSALRKINRNKIYNFLYNNDQASKQDIAYALQMSLPTVTQNIKNLIEKGYILEKGEFESTGGRKAKALACDYSARIAVGLDVTKNHIGIVLVNLKGDVISNKRIRKPFKDNSSYFKFLGALINDLIIENNIAHTHVLGVGIAVPAIVSEDARLVTYSPILGFTGGQLDKFAEYIHFPCLLCNDANAAGTAELFNNQSRDHSVVYLSLNNSVGGAILMNNALCNGENMRAGEFGHMTIVPDGETCYCGQKGCVDVYCNARILADSADGKLAEFFEKLEHGSRVHAKVWEKYLDKLVITINNLRMVFDCNVILGGYVGSYLDNHIDILRERVKTKNTFESNGSYVYVCRYKLEATAVGAALMYIIPFLETI